MESGKRETRKHDNGIQAARTIVVIQNSGADFEAKQGCGWLFSSGDINLLLTGFIARALSLPMTVTEDLFSSLK